MGSKSFKNSSWKCVCLAAAAVLVAVAGPSASAQTAAVSPSSAAFEALPAALSAAPRAAAAAALQPAADPAPAIVVNDNNFKPMRPVSIHDHSRRNWLMLAVASSAAATFDAYTTRRAIQSGAVELNPMLKPFVNSNGLYAAIQVSPVLMDLIGYKMQHSENIFARHTWWIPQALGSGVSISAATHNLGNIK